MSKNSKWIKIAIGIVLILFIGIIVYNFIGTNKEDTKLDNTNAYIVITDYRCQTMQNDGGSHTDIYYEIDLENNNVNKVTESYVANFGGKSKTNKKSTSIKIDSNLSKEIAEILDNIFKTNDINDSNNYDFYTIKRQNEEKNIYNKDTIQILKELIDKIEINR